MRSNQLTISYIYKVLYRNIVKQEKQLINLIIEMSEPIFTGILVMCSQMLNPRQ